MNILITGSGSLVGSQPGRFLFPLFLFLLQIFLVQTLHASEIIEDSVYSQLLKKIADGNRINVEVLKQDRHILDDFLNSCNQIEWQSLNSHPREEQLSFWINGYNAVMLKVISEIPSDKILPVDDASFPDHYQFKIKDKNFTLKQLRDEILRRHYRDERVHFAILDVSGNGPRLRPEAYTGAHLDTQLDEAIRNFISDSSKNKIKPREKRIFLSYIFKDFGDDFLLNYASPENAHKKFTLSQLAVLSFIAQHSPEDIVKYLSDAKYKISYLPREPRLNETGAKPKDI